MSPESLNSLAKELRPYIDLELVSNMRNALSRPPCLRLRVDGPKRLEYTLHVDANFFIKGEKKPPIKKISKYVWTGP